MGEAELPPGAYQRLVTRALADALGDEDDHHELTRVDDAELADRLARHLAETLRREFASIPRTKRATAATALANQLIALTEAEAGDQVILPPRELRRVLRPGHVGEPPPPPDIPLLDHDLLANAPGEHDLGHTLNVELGTADRVDAIIAFIRWTGLRRLRDRLLDLRERGVPVRVMTTTYAQSTQRQALDWLVEHGVDVRVSYDTNSTRLHAKAWLLHRESGFSTAFVGSSNLSQQALVEGIEWNVRVSGASSPALMQKLSATFDSLWADPSFEPYDPDRDAERFDRAVASSQPGPSRVLSGFEIRPYAFQREILEALEVERRVHGRIQNLVVAPTGTGKTIVAALDYKRIAKDRGAATTAEHPRLLFVAHRREILTTSMQRFRDVLGRGDFGELLTGDHRPVDWRHVFASVQSLHDDRLETLPSDHFDMLIVDEFHHGAAPTYRAVLDHFDADITVGLTATPERTDDINVRDLFNGRYAYEMRLWDALDQQLLAPFHYFGIADGVDLSQLRWERGGYLTSELEEKYIVTGHDARLQKVLTALHEQVLDPLKMRAFGFCVSVAHAEYMARRFTDAGIPAEAMSAKTSEDERVRQLDHLRARKINVIFAVDVLTEGVDVPEVDTILLLRPTESATVFLQQLGRGLRHHEEKDVCTVLDFIGNQHRRFRADLRLRALTGRSRAELVSDLEHDFPFLPTGCHLRLDRQSHERLLDNIRETTSTRRDHLAQELRLLTRGDRAITLNEFVEEAMIDLADIYEGGSSRDPRGWLDLRRRAGLEHRSPGPRDVELRKGVGRLLDVDDALRLGAIRALASNDLETLDRRQRRAAAMIGFVLFDDGEAPNTIEAVADELSLHPDVCDELVDLADALKERLDHLTKPLTGDLDSPLHLHATYRREEVLVALGDRELGNKLSHREGVKYVRDRNTDVFFVTLQKSEEDYSPTTRYRDYAISPELFHWESQSQTNQQSPTGQRYLDGSSEVLLFVREVNKRRGRAPGFRFLGRCELVSAEGGRPIATTWRLEHPMPESFFRVARAAAV